MTYRVFYRGGTYVDTDNPPEIRYNQYGLYPDPIWAVIDLEILDGGDAYQAVLSMLTDDTTDTTDTTVVGTMCGTCDAFTYDDPNGTCGECGGDKL